MTRDGMNGWKMPGPYLAIISSCLARIWEAASAAEQGSREESSLLSIDGLGEESVNVGA